MGMNLTGFDAALKDVYGPRIEEQLNIVNVLSDWIDENDSADWTGRQVIYPIHVGRNEGVGASAEGDPLPAAGSQSYAQVKIPERFNYGRIELTGQVIKSSLKDKGLHYIQGWVTMGTMVEGIKKVLADGKPVNGENIKAALETMNNYETGGVTAPITFTATDHRGSKALKLFQVEGGQWKQLTDFVSAQ